MNGSVWSLCSIYEVSGWFFHIHIKVLRFRYLSHINTALRIRAARRSCLTDQNHHQKSLTRFRVQRFPSHCLSPVQYQNSDNPLYPCDLHQSIHSHCSDQLAHPLNPCDLHQPVHSNYSAYPLHPCYLHPPAHSHYSDPPAYLHDSELPERLRDSDCPRC